MRRLLDTTGGGCYLARPMLTTKKRMRTFEFFFGLAAAVFLAGCTPSGPKALLEGDRLLNEGKFSEAIPKLTEAVTLLPQDYQKARAWNRLGLAYQQSGELTKAAQAYQQALKLDRDLEEAVFNLGCVLMERGNAAAAVESLTTYGIRQPQDPDAWLKLGEAQAQRALQITGRERTTQLDAARKNLEQASKMKMSAELQNALGMVHFAKGRTADAVKSFQSALELDPRFGPAILNMAIVFHSSRDLNDRRKASQFYHHYLTTAPANAAEVEGIVRQLDSELSGNGRTASVPSVTNRTDVVRTNPVAGTTAVRPPSSARYKYLSPARPSAGNRTDANRYFLAGLEAQRARRLDEAITNYRKAIQADGSFFEAHYNLELVEFEKGNLPAALNEAEMALSIMAGSVNARYNFALALDRSGFAQDAANELEKLLAQSPGETRAHLLLGSLFAQKLSDMPRARIHFAKVLELEPQHAQAPAIRNWLNANR